MSLITCYNLKYDIYELNKWKNKELGNGLGHIYGYGYGEFWVERYLTNKGYKVISGKYNLSTENSKYKDNNNVIKDVLGQNRYNKLVTMFRSEIHKGKGRIEQSDIFAYKEGEYFFVEVKKDKDKLRDCQKSFARLLVDELDISFIMFNLQSNCDNEYISKIEI